MDRNDFYLTLPESNKRVNFYSMGGGDQGGAVPESAPRSIQMSENVEWQFAMNSTPDTW